MRRMCVAIVLSVVASLVASAFPLTVLYTNDLHARVGRFAGLSAAIAAERESGATVLLFDAGDAWQDHRRLLTNVLGFDQTVTWMNGAAYTAMALGNHETYWGPQELSRLVNEARFPVLCANFVPVGDVSMGMTPSVILNVEGARILVVGLVTWHFLPIPAYPMLRYLDPVVALRGELKRNAGAYDLVFVVAHLSIADARLVSRAVPDVDVFVSGHSHERTEEPVIEGKTIIVQSGAFGRALGRLRLEADPAGGAVEVLSNDLLPIEKTPTDVQAGVRKLLVVLAVMISATALWFL
jgi:2',3'-cyclic-nucleotide 2'-phosphodiesterase (5'-nucleotidase family)